MSIKSSVITVSFLLYVGNVRRSAQIKVCILLISIRLPLIKSAHLSSKSVMTSLYLFSKLPVVMRV